MDRRMAFLTLAACALLVPAGCQPDAERGPQDAEAADAPPVERPMTTPYQDWDSNRDRVLQREEFAQWRADEQVFEDWIGDDGLDRQAVAEGVLASLDTNGDGAVTEEEWRSGVVPLFADAGAWADWDADGSSELDLNEVAESLETRGFYDLLDANSDEVVDDGEIGAFYYDVFDLNDNGEIDVTEWNAGAEIWGPHGGP